MSVRMALLAILCDSPQHGYELRGEFEARTGSVWPLNVGQVYSTLQRLERDGLVTAAAPTSDGHVIHDVANAGRAAASAWFTDPIDRTSPPRDELAMKLSLAAATDLVDVRDVIARQRVSSMRALRDVTRLKPSDDESFADAEAMGWSLALESMVFQTEAEIRWLDHVESRLLTQASRRRESPARRAAKPVPERVVNLVEENR